MTETRKNLQGNQLGSSLILLLALLTALDAMAIDMYLPGMPFMAAEFAVDSGRIQQTLSIFLVGLAVGQCLYGPLLDSFGRRVPLLIGVLVFIIGSLSAAIAPTVEWLMFARLLQAFGAAAGLVVPRAIVADLCTMTEAAKAFSLLMQVMMIAPIAAPLLGGYLLSHGSWRLLFWVLAGVAAISLVWAWRKLPESLPRQSWTALNPASIWRMYAQQLRNGIFMRYTLASGFILGSLFAYISSSAFIFTQYFSLSPVQFSYLFAINSVGIIMAGQVSNWLLKVQSIRHVLLLGIIMHGLAGLLLWSFMYKDSANVWVYATLLTIAIGSLGLVFGNLTAVTMNSVKSQAGVASALMGALQYAVSAIIGYGLSLAVSSAQALPLCMALCALGAALACQDVKRITKQTT